jgi:hypothetical protein
VAIVVVVQLSPLAPQTSTIGPIAGGIGGVVVAIVVVVQPSPLAPQTTTIGPISGGIGGVAVAIVVVVQLSPLAPQGANGDDCTTTTIATATLPIPRAMGPILLV